MLLALVGIPLIRGTPLGYLTPYVDPSLVLIVVLISISVPVRMAWQALMGLLNRTPSEEIVQQVTKVVKSCTKELPVQNLFVRAIQPDRTRVVLAHVALPNEFHIGGLLPLDTLRSRTLEDLKRAHLATVLDMVFTA